MTKSPQTVAEIRESFLKYFESKGHHRERASALIPQNDPTLLFTNAGMVQFKDLFTGKESRSYKRAATCQKCVRAGGKHNDLESVGFTRRHHTFFEMLGNFSFGDYFKAEAIEFAWEYLTQWIGLPKDKLWISVFENDDEALNLWLKVSGLPKERIVKMGEKDNFWAMGDTGPCGPCSEIYIDRGESFGKKGETIFDGGERFLEIWNLVFMQFERFADGKMVPLPKPSVDTGMGLERLASVIQQTDSNYEIDSLKKIRDGFARILGKPLTPLASEDESALRVLTDHIRACSFLIADGVQPSNEGRGYVLRRILRRAIRYGKKLGCNQPFFHKGVDFVDQEMGAVYTEIRTSLSAIKNIIFHEEEKFFETLENGLKLLDSKIKALKKGGVLPGEVAFQLYDTFGFPLDLTEVILKEHSLTLDHAGFQKELEAQRDRSRASWKGSGESGVSEVYKELAASGLKTEFVGYKDLESDSKVLAILKSGQKVSELKSGESGEVILDRSPFYAEGGGQMGDRGLLEGAGIKAEVGDTRKPVKDLFVSSVMVKSGSLKVGTTLSARVDRGLRLKTRINHSITHVLHATLQEVLGDHIKQAGSLVTSEQLRFDFTHFKAVTPEELRKIESVINERIRANHPVMTELKDLDEAIKAGAKAFFDDKYDQKVRVLSIGKFSLELCGGTHAERLGEAGLFKITSESSVASGVRRIVAVTGERAYQEVLRQEDILQGVADLLKSSEAEVLSRVEKLLKEKAELQKKISQQALGGASKDADSMIQDIHGVKTLIEVRKVDDAKELRPLSDHYRQKIKSGLVLIGAEIDGRATVIAAVTDDIAPQFQMKKLVEKLSTSLNGKGGGKDNFAQVGGSETKNLTEAELKRLASEHLSQISVLV